MRWAAVAGAVVINGAEFSEDDIANQEKIVQWVDRVYYSSARLDAEGAAWKTVERDVWNLANAAQQAPELSLGVALVLYSFFWWRSPVNEWNTEAITMSTGLFARSISYNGCDNAQMQLPEFLGRQCHVRWRYLTLLSGELSQYLSRHRLPEATSIARAASDYFGVMKTLPFFATQGLTKPHDANFNGDQYIALQRPVWNWEDLPLARYLTSHYETLKAELEAVLASKPNGEAFSEMYMTTRNAETQFGARELDWETVYVLRNMEWYDSNCRRMPRTCEIVKKVPELTQCNSGVAGAGFVRLRAGARLKPHYGNGPRLTYHLGLITPPGARLHVGPETLRWRAGVPVVFDDTFIHSAYHDGTEDRYIFLAWFCHPCESKLSTTIAGDVAPHIVQACAAAHGA